MDRILLCLCRMSGNEMKYIEEAFADNWVVPLGPNVEGFEEDIERFIKSVEAPAVENESLRKKRVLALSAGTAALHLALIGCGVKPGDEVMVQSFTFAATVNPIAYLGAIPVFVDSEPESWNMDPALLDKAIADRHSKTGSLPKAIVPAYLYGMPARMDEIMAVARKWGIPVVEDAAEGMGSRFDGRELGTFGRYGILSFNGNKIITTSGGGALICADEADRKRMMKLATQARDPYPYYHHTEIGYNYRMSNISAGIGRGQMTVIEEHLRHHRDVQAQYRRLFADIPGITLHDNPSPRYDSNFWLCAITLDAGVRIKGEDELNDRPHTDCEPDAAVEALRRHLDAKNVEARPLWKPMHRQPVYSGAPVYRGEVSESLFRRGLCLPAGPWVETQHVDYIVESIREAIDR